MKGRRASAQSLVDWCPKCCAGLPNLLKSLKSLDALPPPVKDIRSPRVSWWPSVLEGNLGAEKMHNVGFRLFVVERPANSVDVGIYLFALDLSKGRGFFYWTYKS